MTCSNATLVYDMNASTVASLLILGAAVSALTGAYKLVIGEGLLKRLLPLVPLLLGVLGAVLVPSLTPGQSPGERVVWGVLAGAFSGQLYETVRRQFEGKRSK